MTNSSEKSDYQAFIDSKAERYKTPQDLIDKVIYNTVREKPVVVERIIHGEINEVYRIATQSGNNLILRISHSDGKSFSKERWAIEQSAKADVPVPEILSLSSELAEDGPRIFCIQKQIDGIPLDQIQNMDTQSKQSIIEEAGSLLHRIHSVPTKAFGDIDENGIGEFKSIQESLTEWTRSPERLYEIANSIQIDEHDMQKGLDVLERIATNYSYNESHLLHKDFSPKHLLINNNHINGIIDFENAKAGDPIEEFARWDYFFSNEYPLEWLIKGYPDQSRTEIQNFEELLHAWRLNFGFGVLDYYENDKNRSGINHAKKELIVDLKYFA